METLLAFIWAPLMLYGLSVSLALLVEKVLRLELPNALLAPIGLVISLVMPVYRLGGRVDGGAAGDGPGAVVGFGLARRALQDC
jgi:hypothetical protein